MANFQRLSMPRKLSQDSTLDQSIDISARRYSPTADDYAAYLKGEYKQNYEGARHNWDAHFGNTRMHFNGLIYDLTEQGIPREEMNIAIIGPGLAPVGREFGKTACHKVLPRANSLIMADFSAQVVKDSVKQLSREVNMQGTPVMPMLMDITDGLSTAYRRLIQGELRDVQDEKALEEVSVKLDEMDEDELRKKLKEMLVEIDYEEITSLSAAHSTFPDIFQGGGLNTNMKQRYKLTANEGKDDLPLHAVYLPMVIAGTGAAAEHEIWETYLTVTSDVGRGAKPDSVTTREERQEMIRRFYNLITRYNTLAASKAIGDILRDNEDASVLAVSDVSTILYSPYQMGMVPRLNTGKLGEKLSRRGVLTTQDQVDWEWRDEPEHHHGVNAFTFRKKSSHKTLKDTADGDSGIDLGGKALKDTQEEE